MEMFELIPDSFRGQASWEGERDSKAEDGLKVGQRVMIAEFQWAWQVRNSETDTTAQRSIPNISQIGIL